MSVQKCLLMVGGGVETIPGIQQAKQMGHFVLVSDQAENAPGFKEADATILASTYDIEKTVRKACAYSTRIRKIDGVMSLGTDVPMTVSAVAERLSLHCIPSQTAWLATDKLAMKTQFQKDGINIPWFSQVSSPSELRKIAAHSGCPLVIKPVDSRGGRGVMRTNPGDDFSRLFYESKSHSPSGRVMVEQFLPGPQVSTESIVLNGQAHTPGFSDRNYSLLDKYAPYIIENGGDLPSHLPNSIQISVKKLVQKATMSLGINNWVAKGDIVVSNGQPYVIELAARLSGGYFCTHEIPLNCGVNIVEAVIKLALNEPVSPISLKTSVLKPVVQRYIFPKPGRVVSIEGVEEVQSWDGIDMCEIRCEIGDLVEETTCHPSRAGVIIASGKTVEKVRSLAERAISTIQITTVSSNKFTN